ncbi:PIR protein [Plasmodium ovale]|uniref:PIR protein n=1 Tax=Plasmodium ovale TaxID=36330 RepID=A0A1D3JEY3_PLAOA|nr:PIR protein [Plasmodium ovale]
MTTSSDNLTYDELKGVYPFLKDVNFDEIYEEFKDTTKYEETGKTHCTQLKDKLLCNYIEENIQLNFCNILYKVIVKINGLNNNVFNEIDDDKMYCFCLKYWLYDHLDKNTLPLGQNIDDYFQKWQNGIKEKIQTSAPNPCVFRELNWEQREKLKSIYAFILLYYKNINLIPEKGKVDCKYMNFFGKGLKAYYDSLSECSLENEDNYCKEFREFKETYGLDKIYWEISKVNEKYIYDGNSSAQCALQTKSRNNLLYLTYWYDDKKLHLSNEPIDFQKSAIISASSAIGTTVGIPAFLLYLYKYTSLGSIFRTRIQKNNIMLNNMDRENHDNTFPTYEYENTDVENADYNISYFSLNNS